MPTYNYQCSAGHITEKFRRMDDYLKPAVCDTCEKTAKRIITVPIAKPTFGNQDTQWSMREGKRLGTR